MTDVAKTVTGKNVTWLAAAGREPTRRLIGVLVALGLSVSAFAQQPAYLLFGGRDHDVFLGCLNCNSFDQTSLCNDFGKYGNPINGNSIWNPLSRFGNPLMVDSPWNELSINPPVVVDRQGSFYGYFTANRMHRQRVSSALWLRVIALASANDARSHDNARRQLCGD